MSVLCKFSNVLPVQYIPLYESAPAAFLLESARFNAPVVGLSGLLDLFVEHLKLPHK